MPAVAYQMILLSVGNPQQLDCNEVHYLENSHTIAPY